MAVFYLWQSDLFIAYFVAMPGIQPEGTPLHAM
jgi:hypothetical protein